MTTINTAKKLIARNTEAYIAACNAELASVKLAAERLSDEEFAKMYDYSKTEEVENAEHEVHCAYIREAINEELVNEAVRIARDYKRDICDVCNDICAAYDHVTEQYTAAQLADLRKDHTEGVIAHYVLNEAA